VTTQAAGLGEAFSPRHYVAGLPGTDYESHLQGHWTLSPEIIVGMISGGAVTVLGGVAISYQI